MGARRIDNNSRTGAAVRRAFSMDVLQRGFIACLLLMVCAGIVKMYQPGTLPFSKIQMFGDMQWLNKDRLNQAVLDSIDGGFFSLNVNQLKQRVEALPWIKSVAVRRVWPNILQINVSEQKPVAVWNDSALINVNGELFQPSGSEFPDHLVRVSGPDGYHRVLLEKYSILKESMEPQGMAIANVAMNSRRAVTIQLHNGVTLLMGRVQNEYGQDNELRRFARVYRESLSPKADHIDLVDLRYTNGFAVRWKNQQKVGDITLKKPEVQKG